MNNNYPEIEYVVVEGAPRQRAWYKRPGCLVGVVVWFIVMLLPLFLFVLAIQGDITINHRGDVPNKFAHPMLQVKLIMEMDYRGLSITTSSLNREDDTAICIQNQTRYMLWQGSGDPADYCQCYDRENANDDWQRTEQTQDTCTP
jgi:hypothetical protein